MRADDAIRVVHEDADLLVVDKPSGLATTAPDGLDCLTRRLERARGQALHPTSRLDAEVSGLVTFARTKRAIEALKEARREGRYHRLYLALALRAPTPPTGEWTVAIAIAPRDRRLRVAAPDGRGERVQAARTSYETHAVGAHAALLRLRPHTGRTHQLRVHAAHAGVPLLGDARYGGARRVALPDGRMVSAKRVMLCCARLELPRVHGAGTLTLIAPPAADFAQLHLALGGDPRALDVE